MQHLWQCTHTAPQPRLCVYRWPSPPRAARLRPRGRNCRRERAHKHAPVRALLTLGTLSASLACRCRGAAGEESGSKSGPTTVQAACETVQACITLITAKQLDSLIDFVPDEVLDAAILENKRAGKGPALMTFSDVLSACEANNNVSKAFVLDSYARRNLVFGQPASCTLLSSFLARPDRSLHRYAVTSADGEECVLTFELNLQDTLQSQYRSAPLLTKKWHLRSITGEPASPDPSTAPDPSLPPEAVVLAQLAALQQQDARTAFAFASPANRESTGPVERFATMLRNPMYRPLLGHLTSRCVQRMQPSPDTYVEIVEVTSLNTGVAKGVKVWYLWQLERQPGGEGVEKAGCWLTNGVSPVQATSLDA